jgi:pimeloyl-ACP methyl ester carboxylesterase
MINTQAQIPQRPAMTIKVETKTLKGASDNNLVADCYGDAKNPPVLLCHGTGQTRHSWGGTAQYLAEKGWYAIAYDHRGHGDSEWSSAGLYSPTHFASDVAAIARTLKQKPALIGASLGGIAGMIAEGSSPGKILDALILVDITPQINVQGAQNVLSFMGTDLKDGFASLEDAAEKIAKYTGRPKRDSLTGLRKNLRQGADLRYRWHWDPKVIDIGRHASIGKGDSLEAHMDKINIPTLLIRGRMSELVTEEIAAEFLNRYPHAEFIDVENARHMVAGDRNDIFTEALSGFMAKLKQAI